jgi:hypothetical protein
MDDMRISFGDLEWDFRDQSECWLHLPDGQIVEMGWDTLTEFIQAWKENCE